MTLRYRGPFRILAWLLVAAGGWYLYLGARGARDGSTVWPPLAILGTALVAVGSSLVRWTRRTSD
jgi:hypothetical protein